MVAFTTILCLFLNMAACQTTPTTNQIHLLRPHSGAGGHHISGINCLSWRFGVETNSFRDWRLVPAECEAYIGHYMLGKQYREDCNAVVMTAVEYAKSFKLAGDGKDIWIFDIDETSLSNLPYYARSDVAFGAIAYNSTKFNEWVAEGIAPAVPAALKLYKKLLRMGFKIVFLSGSSDSTREVRISNLQRSGYSTWEKLILRKESETGTALVYKSQKRKELEEGGYRIIGNIGDQWSDLLGTNIGNRTFKMPDPMYYIS